MTSVQLPPWFWSPAWKGEEKKKHLCIICKCANHYSNAKHWRCDLILLWFVLMFFNPYFQKKKEFWVSRVNLYTFNTPGQHPLPLVLRCLCVFVYDRRGLKDALSLEERQKRSTHVTSDWEKKRYQHDIRHSGLSSLQQILLHVWPGLFYMSGSNLSTTACQCSPFNICLGFILHLYTNLFLISTFPSPLWNIVSGLGECYDTEDREGVRQRWRVQESKKQHE